MLSALSLSIILALLLDRLAGEISRWHPLVGFGNLVARVEKAINQPDAKPFKNTASGIAAWCLVVCPIVIVAFFFERMFVASSFWSCFLGGGVLYFAIGWRSLTEHAQAVSRPLSSGELEQARREVAKMVSRDTTALNEEQIASAATESVLENGSDALFAALFWFAVLGIPGVVLYRLSNTLDAMWGYKNHRYRSFGWMAARMDDLLNLIPARLTALSYALAGHRQHAFAAWRRQGGSWKSPNAGPVMAAGAGAINVCLGGAALYHGQWQDRPTLGPESGARASASSIDRAIHLINRSLLLWLLTIIAWDLLL